MSQEKEEKKFCDKCGWELGEEGKLYQEIYPPHDSSDWEKEIEELKIKITWPDKPEVADIIQKISDRAWEEQKPKLVSFIRNLIQKERAEAYNEGYAYGNSKDFCNAREARTETIKECIEVLKGMKKEETMYSKYHVISNNQLIDDIIKSLTEKGDE